MSQGSSPRWTVGINLLWLVPDNVGGTEEYAIRLLRALPETSGFQPESVDLAIYVTPRVVAAHPWLAELGTLHVSPEPGTSRARRIALESTWLRRKSAHDTFVHHLGGTLPLGNRVPALLTVHDLQPFDRPDTFSAAKRRWLTQRLPSSIRESTVVMTPSQWVADRIVERFGTDPSRLEVVSSSHGADAAFAAADTPARLGLDRPYVLYPAITYPHKHHSVLLDAIRHVDPSIDLVLTGRPDVGEEDLLTKIGELDLGDRVHRIGRLDAPDFEAVLRSARALVFPSTYEGFGLPIVEAMARNVPVIASDIEVLRETCGGAAALIGPTDERAWAEAINRTGDAAWVTATVAAGRAHSQRFEPAVAAQRLVNVYRRVLGLDPA